MIPLSIFSIDLSSGNLILLVSLLMFVAILMAKVGTLSWECLQARTDWASGLTS